MLFPQRRAPEEISMATTTEKRPEEEGGGRGVRGDSPPGNELAVLLWLIAVLLAAYEFVWWAFDRMLSI
jgi:hypothetical protein